jgi:Holliday junction resolvase YEN1
LDILGAKEGSALRSEEDCRMAMVLIALLGGGDYAPEGIANFGM